MFTTLAESSTHETPNAVMRRYPGNTVAVWRTEMAPGAAGPQHVADLEQVVVVLEGCLDVMIGGQVTTLDPGDAVVLAAGVARRLSNPHGTPVVTLTAATPGGKARVGDGNPVPVPWAA